MNIYENIVVIDASLSDEEVETAAGRIKDLIINSSGEIIKADMWGRRKLAYEINKHKKGFYMLLLFKSPASLIRKLEDYYKVYDPVIKFQVIKLTKKMIASMPKNEVDQGTPETMKKAEG